MADDDAYGATVAKRRLARRLTELRLRTGMKFGEVNDRLGWNKGRVERFERNQWKLPEGSYIRDLARIYSANEAEQAELEDLLRQARQRPWWRA